MQASFLFIRGSRCSKDGTGAAPTFRRFSQWQLASIWYAFFTFFLLQHVLFTISILIYSNKRFDFFYLTFYFGLHFIGKDCSMEQMTEIREQQERLARLHFELGQRQDPNISMDAGFRQSSTNMRHLLQRLQQLSVCIEKLHSK